jgi:hypothetical protein
LRIEDRKLLAESSMDILASIMLTVFGAVVFFTLMKKLLAPTPPAEGEEETPRRAEPTPTDVDRFLAEVNRRRREAERQQSQPAPAPRQESRREPRRERDVQRQRERERQSERPATVVRRVSEEQARRLPTVQLVEAIPVDEPEPPRRVPTGNEGRGAGRISPVLTAALPLLRSPRALGAAIVLQEIFGPPLCRRRRGQ